MYKFAAAWEKESIVFGACKPGYSERQVNDWIEFIQAQGIKRVCCLLDEKQLARYTDFQLCELEMLTNKILPFLAQAEQLEEKVVIHCSGGVGRTGQILTAWLVRYWGFSNGEAIALVKKTGRNPYEAAIYAAITGKNPFKVLKNFNMLLNHCRLT
jgi:hypothetical protein